MHNYQTTIILNNYKNEKEERKIEAIQCRYDYQYVKYKLHAREKFFDRDGSSTWLYIFHQFSS